jgi:hypothetical protein
MIRTERSLIGDTGVDVLGLDDEMPGCATVASTDVMTDDFGERNIGRIALRLTGMAVNG